jgi:AbrB family looped-hinge helix DNA binding protein
MGKRIEIGRAGEVKLPAELLERLGLHEGDALDVVLRDDGTVELRRLEPAVEKMTSPSRHPLLALSGLFKSDAPPMSDEERRKMIGDAILRKGRE